MILLNPSLKFLGQSWRLTDRYRYDGRPKSHDQHSKETYPSGIIFTEVLLSVEMKFITAVVFSLASLVLAAPNPKGQTTSIKLSKDYVDAIVAAYPDVHKRDCSFDFSCGCIFCV
ncbi:hypothetical protein CSAL01_06456 [Colletotrichum salicis]|uniref:Uncharacterized protein n=1 Tax=Colletotrichum salicis TaxID=1209931 RepID=A0A135VAE5_9PEZI|nr:hypothetical protein CSAL01_06456 [Colletotrichum salicis]